jgi:RHS repeat-associated protein
VRTAYRVSEVCYTLKLGAVPKWPKGEVCKTSIRGFESHPRLHSFRVRSEEILYKFEGKERDFETGNGDFGARYYSNRFGRWLSADWSAIPVAVPYANLTNPQTLNLYSMVADDPESGADLDGHAQYGGCGPGLTECNDKGGPLAEGQCGHTTDGIGVCHLAHDPLDDLVKKLQKGVDSFNEYLGFGKSDCAKDCVNALGMAGTAIAVAVISDGASEEGFVEQQISRAKTKITNIIEKDLTSDTLQSANREVNGGMKVAKVGGGFFKHPEKVQRGIAGLSRQEKHLEGLPEREGLSESHAR